MVCLIWIALFFCLFFSFPQRAYCDSNIAVLVSRNIIPYLEAVDGLSEEFSESDWIDLEVFKYENFSGKKQNLLSENLGQGAFNLFIAIGPEASRFLRRQLPEKHSPILYSMVLNPEELLGPAENICGVSLSVPVEMQLFEISSLAPSIKRVGLIYDPAYNESFFTLAKRESAEYGIEIVPLKVSERKNIPGILESGLDRVDGIWMIPDRTVISESIVQYIIKEALLRKKPTIGYNKFFYESGAILAFVFEYRELGKQAADMAAYILSGNPCVQQPPRFHTWVNRKVADKLGIEIFIGNAQETKEGP